jgi:hypothetical protein
MTLPVRDQPNPSEQAKAAAARALEPTGPEYPNEITQSPLHSKALETRARDVGQPKGRHGTHRSDGAGSRRPPTGIKAQQELPCGDDASLLQDTCDDSELASLLQTQPDLWAAGNGQDGPAALLTDLPVDRLV